MTRSERQKKHLAISHLLPVLPWERLCTPQHNKEWEIIIPKAKQVTVILNTTFSAVSFYPLT